VPEAEAVRYLWENGNGELVEVMVA
jgi:hypothetical protein